MSTRRLFVGSLLAGIVLAAARLLFAKTASEQPPTSNTSYDDIDEYIEGQMRHFNMPAISLAIVEGDRSTHFRGFGQTRPGGEAPTAQTPFFIGSVTKSFTALAVMQLVEAGKVELDAPVRRYLPWFRVADVDASTRMTVRHLLNHTSGLSMLQGQQVLADLDDQPGATERQLRALSTFELSEPVGTKFMYNNTNYNLLGVIVEAISGETYTDYIQKHIFDPLEMSHSYTSKVTAQENGLAMGHRYWFGIPIPAPNLPIPLGSMPSGQLISCAEDMAHYLVAQINGGRFGDKQILSAQGMKEMHHGTAKMIVMGKDIGSYAMGWESTMSGKTTIVSHSGIVPDFGAFAGIVPEQNKGIVLLYNVNHAMMKLAFDELGMGAAERLAGETPTKTMFSCAPILMRSMALIPLLQAIGVNLTLKQLRRWRSDPSSQPSRVSLWIKHILLPLIPNLLVASSLIPMWSKMRGWVQLFMPDFSRIADICGSFAALWAILRTGMMLNTLKKHR